MFRNGKEMVPGAKMPSFFRKYLKAIDTYAMQQIETS